MKMFSINNYKWLLMIMVICAYSATHISAQRERYMCGRRATACYRRIIRCPSQCPSLRPRDPTEKACFIDCNSPICEAECKYRRPNCDGMGAACYDLRFVGADGGVFYFHGKKNEHFTLVSDTNLQINARFIGRRPTGRTRDYTWIQAVGIIFGSHNFSVEATKAATWDNNIDHFKFSFDGNNVVLPQIALSLWKSQNGDITLERISSTNSVIVSLPGILEIGVNAVPITKQEDKVHNYQIPSDDCFSHLEVQFRFLSRLSDAVEGVLGRTYRSDYNDSQSRLGHAMPVVGGEDKYITTSLFATDCKKCVFSSKSILDKEETVIDHAGLDCSSENGIVCQM